MTIIVMESADAQMPIKLPSQIRIARVFPNVHWKDDVVDEEAADMLQQKLGEWMSTYKPMLTILRFAVHPGFRRSGVGQKMVEKLLAKTTRRRPKISVLCRETNLDACFFWRSMGFHATDVYRGHYDDTGEDAYHFLAQVDPVGAPR